MGRYKGETRTFDFMKISEGVRKGSYKCLGIGSGRVVFDLDDGNVVKVAKNNRGIAQNEAEYKIALESDSHILANIFGISEKSTFLIMEKANRINKISNVWEYFQVRSNSELYKIKELQYICEKNRLEIKDFGRVVNWGQINGRPTIIDYGFTQQVRKRYYMSPASRILLNLRLKF